MTVDDSDRLMITEPRAIRALLNPARILALDELYRTQRPQTATHLAQLSHVTPSAMSYHLRVLAGHGIIRRSTTDPDRRKRLWEATSRDYSIVASDQSDVGTRAALLDLRLDPLRQRMLSILHERARRPLRERQEKFMVLATGDLYLTPNEITEAQKRTDAIWREYETLSANRTTSTRYRHAKYMWACLPEQPQPDD